MNSVDVVTVARLEDFRVLKSSKLEDFRALKSSMLEDFRALKSSNLATGTIWLYPSGKAVNTGRIGRERIKIELTI